MIPQGHPLSPSGYDASICDAIGSGRACRCPEWTCPACGVGISACKLDDHATLCPRRAVSCPIGCGATVAAASLPDHYRLKCSKYFVRCWGCSSGVPILRKEIEEHRTHWHTKRSLVPHSADGTGGGGRGGGGGDGDDDGKDETMGGRDNVRDDPFRGIPCPLPPQTARCPVPNCVAEVSLLTPWTTSVKTLHRHMAQCRQWMIACPGCAAEMRASEWAEHTAACRATLPVYDLGRLQQELEVRRQRLQERSR